MAEPFAAAFTLRALDRAGRIDLAYKIIRDRWGTWMIDRGASSTNEEWKINGSWRLGYYTGFMRTLSHAWSAGPAEFLNKNTMGLKIIEPGCRKIRLHQKKPESITQLHTRCLRAKSLSNAETARIK